MGSDPDGNDSDESGSDKTTAAETDAHESESNTTAEVEYEADEYEADEDEANENNANEVTGANGTTAADAMPSGSSLADDASPSHTNPQQSSAHASQPGNGTKDQTNRMQRRRHRLEEPDNPTADYIPLCIKDGPWSVARVDMKVNPMRSDQELFKQMRKNYHRTKSRQFQSKLRHLLRVVELSQIRFVEASTQVWIAS